MKVLKVLTLIAFGALLLYGATGLPNRGDYTAPFHLEESITGSVNAGVYYIQNAYKDAATPNMVTVILADYRALDTLGEQIVVLTAGLICFLLLRNMREKKDKV